MKRNFKYVFSIFLAFFMLVNLCNLRVYAENEIEVEARSAILIEPNSGKVIYEKNSQEKFAPASVTKVMTMLLAMEAVDNGKIKLTDKVTISENAKNMGGSTMLLDTGEIRTVEELLKGIGIASGNDAAVAMAEYLGGSQEAFVKMMNTRASELKMTNTNFKNCTGLPAEGHLTTAYDISIMSRELLKHPTILKYTGTYMETLSQGRKTPIELVNHNKLVRFFKGCDGLKTGFTSEAKYCISATAVRDNVRMLTVIMGAPTYKIRNRDASMLMNFGFSKYESKKIIAKDAQIKKVNLNSQGDRYYIVKAAEPFNYICERGSECKIIQKLKLNPAKKNYKKGEIIGECEFYENNKPIGKVKVYSDRDVRNLRFFENLKNNFKNIFKHSI
ncbi:D-alanyl-D-alanine carboxypeptidase family protein [Clostridium oryzae]|uniref:serine-type D-Ala-D-Ala carboxypeptidase n=1 Tax=Clostridium oryzae TaxID=1450648 RepID=A0A1V4IUU2_9CLOT|nr:D-alanyl-D-alanine carboxypeptidase family protein [Clostridium oryzae]OPJ63187.1 D-alanyl-D-alanine carboxypeptidase DacF precursor [Clostridium oryzae]